MPPRRSKRRRDSSNVASHDDAAAPRNDDEDVVVVDVDDVVDERDVASSFRCVCCLSLFFFSLSWDGPIMSWSPPRGKVGSRKGGTIARMGDQSMEWRQIMSRLSEEKKM